MPRQNLKALETDALRKWIGKTKSDQDEVTAGPIAALSATLDYDQPLPQTGEPLAPLRHWLYFPDLTRQSRLAPDGHAQRGEFIPPVPLPRRMYAGGRIRFLRDLHVGDAITRLTRISDIQHKQGRTGPLLFVSLLHEISHKGELAVSEEQDIVYRNDPEPGEPAPPTKRAPTNAQWSQEIQPDPVLLFRYSALTFNGHRIHYDRQFATEIEGYPGLLVHGPLIATLLIDLLRRHQPKAKITQFTFRALRPLFDVASFQIAGRLERQGQEAHLWASDGQGLLATEAAATIE